MRSAVLAERIALPMDEDSALVDRFRDGDMRAFDELVRRYQRPIYALVLRYVHDPDDAKDVAQRSFVRAFEGLGGFRRASTFRTWLYRIAVNLALNFLRDRKPRAPLADDALVIDAAGPGRLVSDEERRRLYAALDELPPKQRLVLELRVYDELPFREVAEIAGCSENAAKVNFHHAVKRLKEVLS